MKLCLEFILSNNQPDFGSRNLHNPKQSLAPVLNKKLIDHICEIICFCPLLTDTQTMTLDWKCATRVALCQVPSIDHCAPKFDLDPDLDSDIWPQSKVTVMSEKTIFGIWSWPMTYDNDLWSQPSQGQGQPLYQISNNRTNGQTDSTYFIISLLHGR